MSQSNERRVVADAGQTGHVHYKGRNPHKRTSWKLVRNPGFQLVFN